MFISRKRNENAADTLSRLFLKGLLSRYCVRARKGTPDIHRSGPSVRAGMTGRSGSPHPPREPCCHMVNPRLALHQPRKRPVFFFCKIYLHHLLTVKWATKNAPKGVNCRKNIKLFKPANKKSSPEQDLTKETFVGGRERKRATQNCRRNRADMIEYICLYLAVFCRLCYTN